MDVNYYKILGVDQNASNLEIKRAYQLKLKKLHPDKMIQTKENKLKYKLVREAGDTLTNILDRNAYDTQRKMNDVQKDFKTQQESFKKFLQLQNNSTTDEDKKIARLNFERSIVELDTSHTVCDNNSLNIDDMERVVEDYKLQRDQEDVETTYDNMFEGKKFNNLMFNSIYDSEKKKNYNKNNSMIKYDGGIMASNAGDDMGMGTGIDKYNTLYDTDSFTGYNEHYSGIAGNSDCPVIDSPDENTPNNLQNIMDERENQDSMFSAMRQRDFGSILDDRYGISNQFGFMVGSNMHKQIDVGKDMVDIYKQLINQ